MDTALGGWVIFLLSLLLLLAMLLIAAKLLRIVDKLDKNIDKK
jgi:hypothetical protein